MFCESRSPRRTVAVLFVVPIVFGAACASKSDADLFDSTPKPFTGRPSAGGAESSEATGGSAASIATGGNPATGGSAAVPVPAKGGSAGADPGEAAAGEPSGMGGAADATGGMTSTGGQPAMTTGGKAATGSAGGSNGGQSNGGQNNGGQNNGGQNNGGSASGGSSTGGKPACVSEAEMCDGVDNDCDGESDEAACPNGCHGFTLDGGQYMFCRGDRSESEAHESCRDEGMRLAWIETAEENTALAEKVAALLDLDPDEDAGEGQVQVRIGGSDAEDEGVWRWEAPGTSVVFWEHEHGEEQPFVGAALDGLLSNWADRRPNGSGRANEDCLVMNVQAGSDGDAGQWNDIFCDDDYPFVCER